MEKLKVGFSRRVINPKPGIGMSGYFITRLCEGVHDDIEANVIVFTCDNKTAVIASLDVCEIPDKTADRMREVMAEAAGTVPEAVMVAATHTHTGPYVGIALEGAPQDKTDEYTEWLITELEKAAREAYLDLKEAKVGYAVSKAENIAFSRRYLMKDGSYVCNPGVGNPDIDRIIGEPDIGVPVVRIDRDGADTIVIANFGCHPDTVGGPYISADWPGVFRRTFERAIDNTKAVFLNGAEGEINHINVFPKKSEANGLEPGFDDVPRGFTHTEHMGRTVAGAVMSVYDKVEYIKSDSVGFALKSVNIPTNRATEEELIEAHRIHNIHLEGRDSELPYSGMFLTTVVAEADRMVSLEFGPDYIPTYVAAISIGKIAFVGIAGEPFSQIGVELKKTVGWKMVVPCALADGWTGYFPNSDAYREGGYEAACSPFKSGVAEILIEEGKKLLDDIRTGK